MRVFFAATVIAFLAGPVYAQTQKPVPQYGDNTGKSAREIEDEKDAERAYKRSLGNIPEQKASDPWGTMRDGAPKPAAKDSAAKDPAAKRTKAGGTGN